MLDAVRRSWSKPAPAIENAETRRQIMRFIEEQVIPAANDARVAALRLGDWYAAASLMNHNGRNFVDNASSLYMPNGFFRLPYGKETLRRVVDRPALLSFYMHLRQSLESVENDPSYPARLRGRTRIPLPFLPEYMGGDVFFDPLEKLAPVNEVFGANQVETQDFASLAGPREVETQDFASLAGPREAETQNLASLLDDGDIAQSVRALAVRGAVSQSDAANAIAKKDQSELWRQVKAQLEQHTQAAQGANAFMDLFQPHTPADIAWRVLTGRPQDIGALFPFTRLVNGAASPIVPGGVNVARPVETQDFASLHGTDYDAYEQYRINSELANMVAEGKIDARAAVYAILEQKGQDYLAAKKRVGETAGVSELSGLGAQVFPEGERRYYKAKLGRDALLNSEIQKAFANAGRGVGTGNPATMTTDQKWDFAAAHGLTKAGTPLAQFAKAHPELKVKGATYDEPERILKDLLVSDLRDKWDTLDKLSQRMVAKQLGADFQHKFLSEQGRGKDYSNVSLEDLVTWAKAFKLQVPQAKGVLTSFAGSIQPRPAPDLRFAPAEQSRKYEQFRTYVASVFNMAQLEPQLDGYYALPKRANGLTPQQKQYRANHPQVDHYLRMYSTFLQQNPDVAFMLNPQGQQYYQRQATMGQTVTQLQKMIRQMGRVK